MTPDIRAMRRAGGIPTHLDDLLDSLLVIAPQTRARRPERARRRSPAEVERRKHRKAQRRARRR